MGDWKPLLPWGRTTMCGAVVDTALSAGLKPIVVAGYRARELVSAFGSRPGVLVVVNEAWELGMTGSIRCGASRIGEAPGFLVAPADMPRIPEAAFTLVIERALEAVAAGTPLAVFAASGDKLGHPVWIPSSLLPGMASLDPGSRLREYLLTQAWTSVQVEDDGIFADFDTPDVYKAESLRLPIGRDTLDA
jgi:molybdenum cofactor cytidylyltransferase